MGLKINHQGHVLIAFCVPALHSLSHSLNLHSTLGGCYYQNLNSAGSLGSQQCLSLTPCPGASPHSFPGVGGCGLGVCSILM